ncbi:MAG: hypothetical protein KVP17_004454 [Porospora cf. gigantea B]|uniref:uncharacterized protein n=1 Tax=Porospora cf. gigantea B TaxID=2853592 RepID=UPI003571C6D4|nr:MAG: hypothetical protein KVP17_004454 [Porospora cf. gigantea B]
MLDLDVFRVAFSVRSPIQLLQVVASRLPGWRSVWLSGSGFLCDAYDLFVIDLVLLILKLVAADSTDPMDPSDLSIVVGSTLMGAVSGQIVIGFLADRLGRKSLFITTATLIAIGALAWWRFVLGVGVGGEYPLSGALTMEMDTEMEFSPSEESAMKRTRLAVLFSMQGLGFVLAPATVLTLALIFPLSYVWRLALLMGAVPPILSLPARCRMVPPKQQSESPKPKIGLRVFLCATCWFILDVTFYGTSSFKSSIAASLGLLEADAIPASAHTAFVVKASIFSLALSIMALPGYYVAVILVNTMSLISLQQAGFILLSCSYLLLSLVSFLGPALPFGTPVKFFLLGVTFFFSNLGPNPTTFILPIEVLPQSARATGHGICSAAGKLGGVVGSVLFGAVSEYIPLDGIVLSCALLPIIGVLFTAALAPYARTETVEIELANQSAEGTC